MINSLKKELEELTPQLIEWRRDFHHHPAFDLDEKALPQAALLMTSLALEFLQRNE